MGIDSDNRLDDGRILVIDYGDKRGRVFGLKPGIILIDQLGTNREENQIDILRDVYPVAAKML